MEEFFMGLTLTLDDIIYSFLTKIGGYIDQLLGAIYIPIVPSSAIVSVGVALTSLFFCLEMFSQLAQFRVERVEDAIRIGMKFIVAKVIIENTDGVSQGIYEIFRISTSGGIKEVCVKIADCISMTDNLQSGQGGLLGIGYLLLFLTSGLMTIYIAVSVIKIIISLMGVFFEIGIHQALAPIALSTLCNDLARPTGIAFIKSYASACLQLTVITAICSVGAQILDVFLKIDFVEIFGAKNPTIEAQLGIFTFIFNFISPLICVIALSKAIKISSDLTKRMFGA